MQDTKKVAGELLVELEKKGVTFETVDGKLKYKDSKGNFTENSKEKVKKYKEEIIEILKKKQTIDEFITDNDYETNVYPLTDVQAAYLVGKTEAVKWGGIGCKGYIEVDFGSYSAEELSRAWKVLVNRHEMLRAKVTEVGFEILERDEIDYEIKIVNLQKMAEREKVDTLSKIREDFSEYVFHTEEPPLFKVLITKRIEGNFFHLLVDLIVSDFASVQLLISEMGELLKGASLEKIRYKFSDYAMFNQQRKGSLKWHQDRMYWLERLKKLPEAPILPQDGRAADKCENTYEFYRFQKHINQSDWKRIKEIAGEYGVTVSSVLIGIYAEVISRWSSNKHFTLNLPIQNRPTIGNNTNSIVGDFTAVNLLEVNVTQNMSFIERVKEITKRLMEDLEHNSFSGVEVLRELSKVSEEKELLMPIVFTGVLKTDGTVGTIEYGFSHTPQVWIDCQIVDEIDSEDQEKGLMISWDTRKGAIKESIVTEMFESFTETIMCMGVLGHLKRDEQEKLLYKLDKNLNINVPILIELLEPKFLVAPVGSRISVATQGRLRYETYITDIKQVGMDQWTWRLTYKVFCGKNIVSTVDSLMSWNYQSVEKILNQLTKMHFRTAKLSETLLLAIKAR